MAAARPDRGALAYGDRTLSFGDLAAAVDRLAFALNVEPGEPVAVVAPNAPALVVGMFAAWRRGAVAVPLSARLRGFELARAFADAQPAAAVSVAAYAGFAVAEEVKSAALAVPGLRTRIVLDELGEISEQAHATPRGRPEPLGSELAAILYTSGTTGEARGALIAHALLMAEARTLAELLGDDAQAPFGLVVPASHAFGLGCLLCGIAAGALAILVEARTSLAPLMGALRAHRATVLHGSPALFARVLAAEPRAAAHRPRGRVGVSARGPRGPGYAGHADPQPLRSDRGRLCQFVPAAGPAAGPLSHHRPAAARLRAADRARRRVRTRLRPMASCRCAADT